MPTETAAQRKGISVLCGLHVSMPVCGNMECLILYSSENLLLKKRTTIALEPMVRTTLPTRAQMMARALALSWGRNKTTPTAAGTNKRPKYWLKPSATVARCSFTSLRKTSQRTSNTKPMTGPGRVGKTNLEMTSPRL